MADEPPPLDFSDEDNTPAPEDQENSELNYTPFRDPVEEPPPVEEQPKQEEKDSREGEVVGVVDLLKHFSPRLPRTKCILHDGVREALFIILSMHVVLVFKTCMFVPYGTCKIIFQHL